MMCHIPQQRAANREVGTGVEGGGIEVVTSGGLVYWEQLKEQPLNHGSTI